MAQGTSGPDGKGSDNIPMKQNIFLFLFLWIVIYYIVRSFFND